jgi:hypothetical protein
MGSHCEPGISGLFLSSEAMKVLSHSSVPILLYHTNKTEQT